MQAYRCALATLLAGAMGASLVVLAESAAVGNPMTSKALHLPVEGDLPSLEGATKWMNSPPLTPTELRGEVVLVEFWTYTCINWRRTLPYVRAWAEKYKDQGLVVIAYIHRNSNSRRTSITFAGRRRT